MKQELEDLMSDIKKTANRVRAKLKGKSYCIKRFFLNCEKGVQESLAFNIVFKQRIE